jgi:hypothetical protein
MSVLDRSSYCGGPAHLRFVHLFSLSSLKYRLEKVVGALVQGPSKPELVVWQRPSVCAPESATISWSLKPAKQRRLKKI